MMYDDLMVQRHQVFIPVVAVLLALVTVGWRASHRNANEDVIPELSINSTMDTIVLPPPASEKSLELTTYRNPFGYEITYPTAWYTLGLPDTYGDQRETEAHHHISPLPINEELHRLMLRPFGCEGDPNVCSGYLKDYTETDYALLDILAQGFDSDIVMPTIYIPEEYRDSAQQIEFPDGSTGVSWITDTKNARIIIVDNERRNLRYNIVIRDPRLYGLDFTKDMVPILSSFHLTE
jgi:hypothetical protein